MHPVTLRVTYLGLNARLLRDAERPGAALPRGAWERSDRTPRAFSGTGFSRECVSGHAAKLMVNTPASSRLKPVPLRNTSRHPVGLALAGKLLICEALLILIFIHKSLSHRQSRLGCRLNAGLAQWAERHGCRESAVRTWMSVRRGPTERDRSEGTLTKEGPNQEQAPLVTWGAFPSNSPKAKQSAPRQTPLILTILILILISTI